MKRRVFLAAGVGLLAAAGFAVRAWSDPKAREVRRIEQRVLGLAQSISFTAKDSAFQKLGYADRVAGFFGPEVDFDITLGHREAQAHWSNGELRERAGVMRASARGLSVQFIDVAVTLNQSMDEATAHLTSKIYLTGEPDYWVQEFRLLLSKSKEKGWQVGRVITVRTME